jgi:hypothetical protein
MVGKENAESIAKICEGLGPVLLQASVLKQGTGLKGLKPWSER